MGIVFAVLLAGILVGRLLAGRKLSVVPRLVTVIIWLLLFLLGVEVGSDPQVICGMATLGGSAAVIFACSVAGSIGAAWLLGRCIAHHTIGTPIADDEG